MFIDIIIIIGIIMLSFNNLRFLIGAIFLLKSGTILPGLKDRPKPLIIAWNLVESLLIITVLGILIYNYYF